jgi:hypothetical protein
MIPAEAKGVVTAERLWIGFLVAGSVVLAIFVSFPTL